MLFPLFVFCVLMRGGRSDSAAAAAAEKEKLLKPSFFRVKLTLKTALELLADVASEWYVLYAVKEMKFDV